jgi:hypothetical protein
MRISSARADSLAQAVAYIQDGEISRPIRMINEVIKQLRDSDDPKLPPFDGVWNHVKQKLWIEGRPEINLGTSASCKETYDYIAKIGAYP